MTQHESMKNVYDIRHDKDLYYIFLAENTFNQIKLPQNKRIAVFVNLYYYDDLEWYVFYLKRIPVSIHIYVFSSDERILNAVSNEFQDRTGCFAIRKENRGRDISALLVAARSYFLKYDYACFVHDKKWKHSEQEATTRLWIENLWQNTLSSESYIADIINLFESKPDIGLLEPPEPIDMHMVAWYYSSWLIDYENTKKLAEQLNLNTTISIEKPPISIGTVFWCRTEALRKLMSYQWKYEDFREEPLPRSGTISHAVERILSFVAQDAGFETGMVMTERYARKLLSFAQYNFQQTFAYLNKISGIENLYQLHKVEEIQRQIKEYFISHEQVFLYGAGYVGKCALSFIKAIGCEPDGFLITGIPSVKECNGLPVYSINDLIDEPGIGIIISVSMEYKNEIIKILHDRGMEDYIIYDR